MEKQPVNQLDRSVRGARGVPFRTRLRSAWLVTLILLILYEPLATFAEEGDTSEKGTVEPAIAILLPAETSNAQFDFSYSSERFPRPLNSVQIAALAAEHCTPAKLILQNHSSEEATASCRDQATRETLWDVRCAASRRLKEEAASNALKLHYALAASYRAEDLLQRTELELRGQQEVQTKLIASGISISDASLVDRLLRDLEDRYLENRSKQSQLRIQLSGLIGSEWACSYFPQVDHDLAPSDQDVCRYLQTAMECRQEIALLKRLRRSVDMDHLELWDRLAGYLIGTPVEMASGSDWRKKIRRVLLRNEFDQAIANRKNWLETLIQERTKQIAIEVEVAFESKRTAALRWANAKQLVQSWEGRIEELEKLGEEYQGNLASQSEARLQRLASERPEIERWLDWNTAQTNLLHACGILPHSDGPLR